MLSGRIIAIHIAFLLLGLAACTRPESQTSTLKVLVPQSGNSGQSLGSSDRLVHVIINATGEGIGIPILMTWDACHDCDSATAAAQTPASFSLDIPMGNNRLVQVLAVYKNNDTNSMKFYYGDKLQNFSSATESMIIPISALGEGSAIVSGRIAGRYLTSASAGPTGPLDIVYTPAGKPSLVIERSSMVNGWFQVFGLAGLPLGYRSADGSFLFGKSLDLLDSSLSGSQKVLRSAVPANYREDHNGGASSWVLDEPTINVYGFFGPGADSTRYVCKPSSFSSLTNLARANSPDGSVKLTYSAAGLPAASDLINTSSPLSSYYVEGGDSASITCASPTAANLYSTYLMFESDLIDGNGNDRSAGFTVPFEWNAQKSAYSIDSSDPRVISGVVLPGVETVIDSLKLFKKPTADDDFYLDQVDCRAIAGGAMGFVPAGSGSIDASTRAFSVTSNISSAEVTAGVSAVLCSAKSGLLTGQGIFIQKWNFSGNYSMPAGPPHHLQITTESSSVNAYGCTYVSVEVVDANNNPTLATSDISFTVAGDGGKGGKVDASSGSCGGGITSTNLTISSGADRVSFEFQAGSVTLATDHLNVSGISGSSIPSTMLPTSAPIVTLPSNTITQLVVAPTTQGRINVGTCLQLDIQTVDSLRTPINVGANTAFTLATTSYSQNTPFQIYTDAGCTAPLASGMDNAMILSGTSLKTYYVKGLAEGSGIVNGILKQNFTIDGVSKDVESKLSFYVHVVPTSEATRLTLTPLYNTGTEANSGNCLALRVDSENDSSVAKVTTGDLYLNSQGSVNISGDFYSDSLCSMPVSGGGPIPFAAESTKTVYFRPLINYSWGVEGLNIHASLSGGAGQNWWSLPGQYAATIESTKFWPVLKINGSNMPLNSPIDDSLVDCAEIFFELRNSAGALVSNLSGNPISLNMDFNPGGLTSSQVFASPGCVSGITPPVNANIPPGVGTSSSFYIKAGGMGSGSYMFNPPSTPVGMQWINPGTIFNFIP